MWDSLRLCRQQPVVEKKLHKTLLRMEEPQPRQHTNSDKKNPDPRRQSTWFAIFNNPKTVEPHKDHCTNLLQFVSEAVTCNAIIASLTKSEKSIHLRAKDSNRTLLVWAQEPCMQAPILSQNAEACFEPYTYTTTDLWHAGMHSMGLTCLPVRSSNH